MNLCVILLSFVSPAAAVAELPVSAAVAEQFEASVRPILVKRCTSCHGAETQESGLRLDSRQGLLQGGESGPAVELEQPSHSRILSVIRYADDPVQMPPDGKLPAAEIAILRRWVEQGAPWPEQPVARGMMEERIDVARSSHWALQPVTRPELPAFPTRASGEGNPVDAFISARARAAGIQLSGPASRRSLIRRATYDLTGLPPTPQQIAGFLADRSPNALEKLIERLLASPEYGKRWGRHWLDVARYADTRGYSLGREPRLPFAYTYRDYVIRAFNEDKPYDQFVMEQLAADQLPLSDVRDLAAIGFLTVGRRYGRIHDTIDDRIDVVTRGLVGLTAGCARCHDHKFDPIPTADYYSLYGIFASCDEPDDLPLIVQRNDSPAHQRFFSELATRQQALDSFVAEKHAELLDHLRSRVGEYLVRSIAGEDGISAEAGISLGKDEIKPRAVQRWQAFLAEPAREDHPVFGPWKRFASLSDRGFARAAATICDELADQPAAKIHPLVRELFAGGPPESMLAVAQAYGRLFEECYARWKVESSGGTPLAANEESLLEVLFADETPTAVPLDGELRRYFDRETNNRERELQRKIEEWNASSPDAPPRAMVLADRPNPVQPVVFQRGDPARPGPAVPRRFLQVLSGQESQFREGSGRRELAQAIARRDNPLTARVLVNRVWMHHFGRGLVETPSDFGIRTNPPSHPELLDFLAWTFMEGGWSIKQLHRQIMLSQTYRQSSLPRPECLAVDPENRLFWRMNRRRLEFEAFRDSLLFVAGELDGRLEGRPVEMWKAPFSRRSTIYGLVDRQHLAGVLRIFDFASPDASTPRRMLTVVPQQALFAMNSPFVAQQAEKLVERPEVAGVADRQQRIDILYEIVLGRSASPAERDAAGRFLAAAGRSEPTATTQEPWQQLAQTLLMSNELMFVD